MINARIDGIGNTAAGGGAFVTSRVIEAFANGRTPPAAEIADICAQALMDLTERFGSDDLGATNPRRRGG